MFGKKRFEQTIRVKKECKLAVPTDFSRAYVNTDDTELK